MSRIIRPDFQTLSKGSAAAIYAKNEHTWKVALKGTSASTANDTLLCLDDELGRWSYDVGVNTKAWAISKNGTTYFGDLSVAKIYRVYAQDVDTQANYTDSGTPILSKICTGWINPSGNPNTTHLLRDVRLYLRVNSGTTIVLEIETDYQGVKDTIEFQALQLRIKADVNRLGDNEIRQLKDKVDDLQEDVAKKDRDIKGWQEVVTGRGEWIKRIGAAAGA
jgi:hypothetical protein